MAVSGNNKVTKQRKHNREKKGGGKQYKRNKNGGKQYKRKKDGDDDGRRKKHDKLEIVFDPDERKRYLTSLSSRKKERRSFGLAMQKVKDRRSKLKQRREDKQAKLEQVEEAEQQKESLLMNGNEKASLSDNEEDTELKPGALKESNDEGGVTSTTATFQDKVTQSQFGGQVIVTTTFGFPDEENESDEDSKETKEKNKQIDKDQRYAGSVERYMKELKGNRRKVKTNTSRGGKKGKHGAAGMQGMGDAQDFKMAQKVLSRKTRGKKNQRSGGAAEGAQGAGGGKRKKRRK